MLNTAHTLLNTLNATIKTEVAKYPNFILVDESNALAGHDVCSSSPWVNQVNGVSLTDQTPDDESLLAGRRLRRRLREPEQLHQRLGDVRRGVHHGWHGDDHPRR